MKLKVTQIGSTIGRTENHKRVVEALGLGKLNRTKIHDDSPAIRGMIKKVSYLLKVETLEDNQQGV